MFLTKLLLNVLLVDSILNLDFDESHFPSFVPDRTHALVYLTSSFLIMFAAHHYFHYQATTFGAGGAQRLLLQQGVLSRFMFMDDAYRDYYTSATISTAMIRDAPMLVAKGYMSMFDLCEQLGKTVAIMVFFILARLVFHKNMHYSSCLPMVLTPPLLLAFASLRAKSTDRMLSERNHKQDELAEIAYDACENFELIAGYNQRAFFVERLKAKVQAYHKVRRAAKQRLLNNNYFAPWLSQVFVAVYVVAGGLSVIHDRTTLGMFLTNIKIIGRLGEIWAGVYKVYVDVAEAGPCLLHLMNILNCPTESIDKMRITRHFQRVSAVTAAEFEQDGEYGCYDCMEIVCRNMHFPGTSVRMKGQVAISQGEFVVVIGTHAAGKASLLKTIGWRMLPDVTELDQGSFFNPMHLRVLHIGAPLFFDASLM